MITEKEVRQAIEQCLKEPITGTKRSVLADLIIIEGYLFGESEPYSQPVQMVSYLPPPTGQAEDIIRTNGGSEFLEAVNGKKPERIWQLLNELMEAVRILHPRMYDSVILKLQDL